jgi:hypothetical protein
MCLNKETASSIPRFRIENVPPIYGKVFVAVKPVGTYTITENQKKLIVENILKPIGLVGVS